MSIATREVEAYHARLAKVGRTRFPNSGNPTLEVDPALPGVRFYRFEDGSVVRRDPNGDLQPS